MACRWYGLANTARPISPVIPSEQLGHLGHPDKRNPLEPGPKRMNDSRR
jgi:hypothetical protein